MSPELQEQVAALPPDRFRQERRTWLVRSQHGSISVEADKVRVTEYGALIFANNRNDLVQAFSPTEWYSVL